MHVMYFLTVRLRTFGMTSAVNGYYIIDFDRVNASFGPGRLEICRSCCRVIFPSNNRVFFFEKKIKMTFDSCLMAVALLVSSNK